jgi:hypothetical protein
MRFSLLSDSVKRGDSSAGPAREIQIKAHGNGAQRTTSYSRRELTIDQAPFVLISHSHSHPATSCLNLAPSLRVLLSPPPSPGSLCQRTSRGRRDLVPFALPFFILPCVCTPPFQKSTAPAPYLYLYYSESSCRRSARLGHSTDVPVALT